MLYNLVYILLAAVALPGLLYKRARYGKYRQSLPGMLGKRLADFDPARFAGGSIVVHAVSVGEVVAARAIIPELRRRFPGVPLVVTTTTETGQAQAQRLLGDKVDALTFFPVDWTSVVRRFHDTFRPRLVVLLEGELWPNFLLEAHRRDCRVAMINADLSARSFRGYRAIRWALRRALDSIDLICVQTPIDAERYAALLGRPGAVHVAGNIKFDSLPDPLSPAERAALARELGLPAEQPAIVFGSTHAGEERIALQLLAALRAAGRRETLILCPRHPERFADVADMVREFDLGAGRRPTMRRASEVQSEAFEDGATTIAAPDVLLIDRMGVLARAFALGRLAVLGGSFAPVGGHNILEPAAHGIPVLYGPHMFDQPELVRLLGATCPEFQVAAEDLPTRVLAYLRDPELLADAGRRARAVADGNRGAAGRCADLIEPLGAVLSQNRNNPQAAS